MRSSTVRPIAAPVRTRAATRNEERAVTRALIGVVGEDEARRLMELGEPLRAVHIRPQRPVNAIERALELMESAEGREQLATLTWDTL